jgi:peroxiredoxin
MKSKYLFSILLFIFIFTNCKNEKSFIIEGNIPNLTANSVYFISTPDEIKIDTIHAKDGKFTYKSSSDTIIPILIYMEKKTVWITVWAKNGDEIKMEGDVNCPELIEVEGNEINNLLTEFKTKNLALIKERCELTDEKKPDNIIRISNLEDSLRIEAGKFIQEHLSSVAALVLIQDYLLDSKNQDKIEPYLAMIEGETKNDKLYKKLHAIVEKYHRTAIGSPAPDFSLVTEKKNDTISLNTFKDKFLLLTFEASWCAVCDGDYAALVDVRKKFSKDKLEILTVALDENKEDWEKKAKKEKITWHRISNVYGLASEMVSLYNVNTIPNNFLIDKEGIIVAKDIPNDSLKILLELKIKS